MMLKVIVALVIFTSSVVMANDMRDLRDHGLPVQPILTESALAEERLMYNIEPGEANFRSFEHSSFVTEHQSQEAYFSFNLLVLYGRNSKGDPYYQGLHSGYIIAVHDTLDARHHPYRDNHLCLPQDFNRDRESLDKLRLEMGLYMKMYHMLGYRYSSIIEAVLEKHTCKDMRNKFLISTPTFVTPTTRDAMLPAKALYEFCQNTYGNVEDMNTGSCEGFLKGVFDTLYRTPKRSGISNESQNLPRAVLFCTPDFKIVPYAELVKSFKAVYKKLTDVETQTLRAAHVVERGLRQRYPCAY